MYGAASSSAGTRSNNNRDPETADSSLLATASEEVSSALSQGIMSTRQRLKELHEYAEEGHWSWRVLGLFAGGCMVAVGAMGILSSIFRFDVYHFVLYSVFAVAGLLAVMLEMNVNVLTRRHLATLRREAHFLFRPWGRALFYLLLGMFMLTQHGPLDYTLGLSCIIIGSIVYYSGTAAVAALNALHGAQYTEETVKQKFATFDINHDGTLDSSELEALCMSLGSRLNHHEVEAAMFVLDINGDGRIDETEFLTWWKRRDYSL